MTNYRPVGDSLVVKKREDESASQLLTVVSKEKPKVMYADVLAIGNEVTEVKVGDVVAANYYAGSEYDGVIFLATEAVLFTIDE